MVVLLKLASFLVINMVQMAKRNLVIHVFWDFERVEIALKFV